MGEHDDKQLDDNMIIKAHNKVHFGIKTHHVQSNSLILMGFYVQIIYTREAEPRT